MVISFPAMSPRHFVAACAFALAACKPAEPRHGVALSPALPRPAFTLTDTRGAAFDFRKETAGQLTFLFFGYTNCPDVCPVHVANVAAVLHTLPYEDQRRARFVFVTLDPVRDSAVAVRKWLDHFDPTFVGLRGDTLDLNNILAGIGMPPAIRGTPDAKGAYEVAHSAAVVVYTADDSAHVMYPFGTRQSDWAEDIPRLLAVRPRGGK